MKQRLLFPGMLIGPDEVSGTACSCGGSGMCGLFMPHLGKTNLVLMSTERFHQAVDTVPGQAEKRRQHPSQLRFQ